MLLYMLVLPTVSGALMSEETLARRSLTRFQPNHTDHAACWERSAPLSHLSRVSFYKLILQYFNLHDQYRDIFTRICVT
jgi:hypothetical protein